MKKVLTSKDKTTAPLYMITNDLNKKINPCSGYGTYKELRSIKKYFKLIKNNSILNKLKNLAFENPYILAFILLFFKLELFENDKINHFRIKFTSAIRAGMEGSDSMRKNLKMYVPSK